MRHHRLAGTTQDPDIDLVTAYPVSRRSLCRKLLRDVTGISGLKRMVGLFLMDLGYLEYNVSGSAVRVDQTGRARASIARTALGNLHGVVLTNAVMFGVLFALGHPALYLLWIGSYLTTFSVFVRVRSIAEHACTRMDADPLHNTRTTQAGWLARLTVAPHRVSYHLEHHLVMTAPHYSLPKIHRALAAKGALRGAFVAKGYLEVLRLATSGPT